MKLKISMLTIFLGNEARYFTIKSDTTANRDADVTPPAPSYNYTDLPDSQYDIPPFVGKFNLYHNKILTFI